MADFCHNVRRMPMSADALHAIQNLAVLLTKACWLPTHTVKELR